LTDEQDTVALVEENLLGEYTTEIVLSVKGTNPTPYFSALRTALNEIFDTYTSADPTLLYTVIEDGDHIDRSPRFVNEEPVEWQETMIKSLAASDLPFLYGERSIDAKRNIIIYNINPNINPHITINHEDKSTHKNDDHSTTIEGNIGGSAAIYSNLNNVSQTTSININIQECTKGIALNLKELFGDLIDLNLKESFGNLKEYEGRDGGQVISKDVQDLAEVANQLEGAADLLPDTAANTDTDAEKADKEKVAKSVPFRRLKKIMNDLEDENSALYKYAKRGKKAVETAQAVAKKYNSIAQWLGWPQVPKPFLKD
jgi:hypothetical protein